MWLIVSRINLHIIQITVSSVLKKVIRNARTWSSRRDRNPL